MSDAPPKIEPGLELAHYRLVEKVGEGGMGVVWRARDSVLGREVAIKILPARSASDPIKWARFEREAKILASLSHANIAVIHGLHQDRGIRFLALELVRGEDLSTLLARGSLAVEKALHLLSQVAESLEAAHRAGVIHRDLKPSNIRLTPDGGVKLLDFGLAKEIAGDGNRGAFSGSSSLPEEVTVEGGVLGTTYYMSPEQVRGEDLDARTDIWSFGCVLFECLSGRVPFRGKSTVERLAAVLSKQPSWKLLPPEVPDELRKLIERCLEKDRDRRPPSMAEVGRELERVRSEPIPDLPPTLDQSPPSTLDYLQDLGNYTVVERLGAGGSGEVYRAWDQEGRREVSVKVLRPHGVEDEAARGRLRSEARALARIDHPNVAALHDVGSHGGLDFVVMEHVPGESLAAMLAAGPLPESEVIRLGMQIAAALDAAHREGVIHRDLKPGNVLVTPGGTVKVVDFGLARLEETEGDDRAGGEGDSGDGLLGPLAYLAPELLDCSDCGPGTDIYALGVVLYQMATGQRPFTETSDHRLREVIRHHAPKPPSELNRKLSPLLDGIILRCLEKATENRYASAAEVAADFQRLAYSSSKILPPARRSRRAPWIAAIGLGVLAAAGAIFWEQSRSSAPAIPDEAPVLAVVVPPSKIAGKDVEAFLTEAVPNAISSYLVGIEGLETKAPPSSAAVELVGGDLGKIAEAYRVQAVVVTALSAAPKGLAMNIQLVEAATSKLLWGHVYVGENGYLELARRGAEGIKQALRPGDDSAILPGHRGPPEAESMLQRGLYASNLYARSGLAEEKERAREAFLKALEIDPENAEAAAGMAILLHSSLATGVSILEIGDEIEGWVDRALEIDPRSSGAWAVRSALEGGRLPESYVRKLDYALKAASFGPRQELGHRRLAPPLMIHSTELAIVVSRYAARLDPLSQTGQLLEALVLMAVGRTEEALRQTEEVLANDPDMPFGLLVETMALAVDGRHEEALEHMPRIEELADAARLPRPWVTFADDLAHLGVGDDTAAKDRLIRMARGEMPFPRWDTSTQGVAPLLAHYGYREEALDLLLFRFENGIQDAYDLLLFHPDLASLRDDERFDVLLDGAAERFDAMVSVLEEARARGELPDYLQAPLADLLGRIRATKRAA